MSRRIQIDTALFAALCSLALIVIMLAVSLAFDPIPSQERFEVYSDPAGYAEALKAMGAGLRAILFIDTLFLLSYTVAIGFVALVFVDNARPAAWVAGIGIILVMALDMFENATMVQSLEIAMLTDAIEPGRIALLTTISAMKWQLAAATLLAMSFVLPRESTVEKLLVWGTRIGLPVAAPLFVYNAFGLREIGGLLLLVTMAGGFALLAVVLRRHAGAA